MLDSKKFLNIVSDANLAPKCAKLQTQNQVLFLEQGSFKIVILDFMKKENILSFISILIIFYATILNIFFQPPKTYSKTEVKSVFPALKSAFSNEVLEHSDSEIAGLGLGYLVGEKDEIPEGIEKKMQTIGLAHIIVVSGTHLSIIMTSMRKLFEKVSRFSALYFSIFLLISYIGLVGVSPSLLRAGFVAIFNLFAWFFGRELKPERTVLLTMGFCLLINPYFLTKLSFQLSILAYAGIMIIFPELKKFFYGRKEPKFIGQTILSSFSALITCLPLQLYFFGTFNFLSILANLLILPTIPLTMALNFITGILGLIRLDFLANFFGTISSLVLKYHTLVINFIDEKAEFLIETPKKNFLFLGLYLILVFSIILLAKNRRKKQKQKFQRLKELKTLNIWE